MSGCAPGPVCRNYLTPLNRMLPGDSNMIRRPVEQRLVTVTWLEHSTGEQVNQIALIDL